MAKKKQNEQGQPADKKVPPGVKLFRTLEGHRDRVYCVEFEPQGDTLASGSADYSVKLWNVQSGKLLRTLEGHSSFSGKVEVWQGSGKLVHAFDRHEAKVRSVAFAPEGGLLASGCGDTTVKLWDVIRGQLLHVLVGHTGLVTSVAFAPQGRTLASGSWDDTVKLWDVGSGQLLSTLQGHQDVVVSVAYAPQGGMLASGSDDTTVKLWKVGSGKLIRTLEGHKAHICSVAYAPQGGMLASGSGDATVKLWEVGSGKLIRTLEGHTGNVDRIGFSPDGRLLASRSRDHTIRLWNCGTWETVAVIPEQTSSLWIPALAFHPALPLLATAGSEPNTPEDKQCRLIHLWELDYDVLLKKRDRASASGRGVHHHMTAKIVLVGDHSVGKSALGYRLIHGRFEKQESTHGQKFWVFPELGKRRVDGTECEAILWDFAGQPDYRLVHALFVDNADLALVLFDAADIHDPLHGVAFWLKQLQRGQSRCPIILVAAQTDRGTCSMTPEELSAFCKKNNLVGPVTTSALTGAGITELVERMKSLIPWEEKATTVTTTTFKRIKDYVLGLKEGKADGKSIVTPKELRGLLEATDAKWQFTDAEMLTAVGHLENYGYVKRLKTSKGELRILLQPERLNNLASSFVLEARRNPKGLGALEEKKLLSGGYVFPELKDLHKDERDVLLDSAALLFLEHNVCFRETDPLRMEPYLVFPELINLKKPPEEEGPTEEGAAYTVKGPTENVFAALVVLLGYTHTFTRTAQWHDNARYVVGDGQMCGFRQEAERDGELDFVFCFGPQVQPPARTLFQGLFESFLARRNLTVLRFDPVRCTNAECGSLLDRSVMRQRLKEGKNFAFCNECGANLMLPKMAEPIQLSQGEQAKVDSQRHAAEQRTRFEQAVFRVRAYVAEQKITPPECFISYAWGVPEHERWVEKRLAADLLKAGIEVLLDRWHNTPATSIQRFVDRLEKVSRVIVVGTKRYRLKYDNQDPTTGTVVAAESKLISVRMRGPEHQQRTVVPALLEGVPSESLPPFLHDQVFCDFRDETRYFVTAFDLILSLYQLPPNHPAVADLRESLSGMEMR